MVPIRQDDNGAEVAEPASRVPMIALLFVVSVLIGLSLLALILERRSRRRP
jgi:hypothetical protein